MFGKVKESEQHLNINWKHFYLSVLALVIPMALQNLINVGVTAADVVMLGKVGEHALSGASLAGQVQYIMTLFLFGLTSGATVLTAQYWGKKDICTIEKILGLGMRSAVIVTAVFFVAAQCIPHTLMKIFTSDPEVIEQGVVYLRIVSWSYIFMGITQTYLYIMRSVERVVVATVVYLCSLICNVGINAVLIFGLFGMPALGVKGAAIGTLTARLLEMVLVCLYSHFWNKDIKFHTKYFLHTEKVLNRDFLKYAFPVILNEVLWGLGTAANTAVLGHMGSAAVAANSVAQVASSLQQCCIRSGKCDGSIYLGKTIGEKKYEHAKAYARRFVWLSVLMGVLGGILILAIAPFMAEAMTLSETARGYMRFMFFVMSYFVVGQAYNTTLIVGTFRSGGDTQFGLILDMSTMWGCSILFGALAAFVFHCNVPVVYMILMSDEIIKIPITWYRYKSYKWLKNVTREEL